MWILPSNVWHLWEKFLKIVANTLTTLTFLTLFMCVLFNTYHVGGHVVLLSNLILTNFGRNELSGLELRRSTSNATPPTTKAAVQTTVKQFNRFFDLHYRLTNGNSLFKYNLKFYCLLEPDTRFGSHDIFSNWSSVYLCVVKWIN